MINETNVDSLKSPIKTRQVSDKIFQGKGKRDISKQ